MRTRRPSPASTGTWGTRRSTTSSGRCVSEGVGSGSGSGSSSTVWSPECATKRKPGVRRPATLPRYYAFNRVVGLDTVEIDNWARSTLEPWLNIVCWGVVYAMSERVGESAKAALTWQAFDSAWLGHYGKPEVCVTDGGLEFRGEFEAMAAEEGMFHLVMDGHAPWQNGRTERVGGAIKQQVALQARKQIALESPGEFERLVWACVAARNRHAYRSGFSPDQRVYGVSHRLPRSLTSDDMLDPDELALETRTDYTGATTRSEWRRRWPSSRRTTSCASCAPNEPVREQGTS